MRKETKHTFSLLAGTGITAAFSLAYMVFAARTLGPAVSADFFAVIALVALCQVALGPINGTVARFSAAYADDYGKIRTLCREIAKRHQITLDAALYHI